MASGKWWNIWTLASAQAEEIVPHTIQSATEPKQGAQAPKGWGQIYTVAGPYATKNDALAAIGKYHGPPPGSTGPKDTPPNPLAQIGAFLGALGQANTWIRVAEVLVGLILMAAGFARITNAVPIATKIATAVGTRGLA